MTKKKSKELGENGEYKAVSFFDKKGYLILEKNYRCKYGEIDLIVTEGESLVFVEVKSRSSAVYGLPGNAVTPRKRYRIKNAASYYMQRHLAADAVYKEVRFDVVELLVNNGKYYLRHIENAYV